MLRDSFQKQVKYPLYEYIMKNGLLNKPNRMIYDSLYFKRKPTILLCDNTFYVGAPRSQKDRDRSISKGISESMVGEFRNLTSKNFFRINYLYKLREQLNDPYGCKTDKSWLDTSLDLSLHLLNSNVFVLVRSASKLALATYLNSMEIEVHRFSNYLFQAITGEKPLVSTFNVELEKFLVSRNMIQPNLEKNPDFSVSFFDKHSKCPDYAKNLIDFYVDSIVKSLEKFDSERLNMIISLYYMSNNGAQIPEKFHDVAKLLKVEVEPDEMISCFLTVHQTTEVVRDASVDFFLENLSDSNCRKFICSWLAFLRHFQLKFSSCTIINFDLFDMCFQTCWSEIVTKINTQGKTFVPISSQQLKGKIFAFMFSVTPSFFRRLFALLSKPSGLSLTRLLQFSEQIETYMRESFPASNNLRNLSKWLLCYRMSAAFDPRGVIGDDWRAFFPEKQYQIVLDSSIVANALVNNDFSFEHPKADPTLTFHFLRTYNSTYSTMEEVFPFVVSILKKVSLLYENRYLLYYCLEHVAVYLATNQKLRMSFKDFLNHMLYVANEDKTEVARLCALSKVAGLFFIPNFKVQHFHMNDNVSLETNVGKFLVCDMFTKLGKRVVKNLYFIQPDLQSGAPLSMKRA